MLKWIKQKFDIDLKELVAEYRPIADSGAADKNNDELSSLAAYAYYRASEKDDAESVKGLIQVAFAIGYRAGKAEPDLSLFEEAVPDDE
jgi:hypothetical protein